MVAQLNICWVSEHFWTYSRPQRPRSPSHPQAVWSHLMDNTFALIRTSFRDGPTVWQCVMILISSLRRANVLNSKQMLGINTDHQGLTQAASQRQELLKQSTRAPVYLASARRSSFHEWVPGQLASVTMLREMIFLPFPLTTLVGHLQLVSVLEITHFYILGHLCIVLKNKTTSHSTPVMWIP